MILYLFIALVLAAAVSDAWRLKIPNVLTFGLAGLFVGVAVMNASAVAWSSHLGAGLLVLSGGAVLFRFGLFGGGDIKLWAATSLWIGLEALPLHLFLVATLGGLLALVLVILRAAIARLRAASPALGRQPLPRILVAGEGIPYGIAIAGSSLLLADRVAELENSLLGTV